MATDKDICKACDDLKYNAPHFMANGLTEQECQSLMNNTGLNPRANHDDCEDLHNMQDCLMEGLKEDIPAYDDCDWKSWATDLMTNLNNMLNALICVVCGLWDEIARIWAKIQSLCDGMNTLLQLIRGADPNRHFGTFTDEFYNNIRVYKIPGTVPMNVRIAVPNFKADILSGTSCDTNKRLGRWGIGVGYTESAYPGYYGVSIINDMQNGQVIGTIPAENIVGNDISLDTYKNFMRTGALFFLGVINGDTSVYWMAQSYVNVDGQWINESLRQYGENTCVIKIFFVGQSRKGSIAGDVVQQVRSYDI